VLIFWKRCKIEIYLEWKTNRKSYMAYQMAATAVILKVIHRLRAFSNAIRRTFVKHFTQDHTDPVYLINCSVNWHLPGIANPISVNPGLLQEVFYWYQHLSRVDNFTIQGWSRKQTLIFVAAVGYWEICNCTSLYIAHWCAQLKVDSVIQ